MVHLNQDKFGAVRIKTPSGKEVTLSVVCDGVSLGYEGKYASYNTVLWLLQWAEAYFTVNEFDSQKAAAEINAVLVKANHDLNSFSDTASDKDTCCTVCGLVTDEENVLIFNAGDSRMYEIVAPGQARCLTQDDTASDGHSIAMHIGGKNDEEVKIAFSADTYHPTSKYLMCSDGFYRMMDFEQWSGPLLEAADRESTIAVLQQMTEYVRGYGETDDVTVIILAKK